MHITSRNVFLVGLCAAGCLAGFAARRLSGNPPSAGRGGAAETTSGKFQTKTTEVPTPAASGSRSADTLESLAALDDATLYGRLALWLIDVGEPDIAAFWKSYSTRKKRDWEINQLVFIHWTRLNPQSAMAAAVGTDAEFLLWRAWAGHDPGAALHAASGAGQSALRSVAYGIGQFQADWLRLHFDELPEAAREDAFSGLTSGGGGGKPLEKLNFLKGHRRGFDSSAFKDLVAQDPWAAYDWLRENPSMLTSNDGGDSGAMEILVKDLGASQPETLRRLAEQAPSGESKRRMEAELFKNLLEADPEAALAQAKATKAPVIAAGRLAAAGLTLVQKDPEQALEIARNLFAVCPNPWDTGARIEYAGGASSWGGAPPDVGSFFDALIAKTPAELLEMVPPGKESGSHAPAFSQLASKWAGRDLVSYTQWVNQQSDPAVRNPAAEVVANQLMQDEHFSEALEWVATLGKSKDWHQQNFYNRWKRSNPVEAGQWLESSNLPEERKQPLRQSGKP